MTSERIWNGSQSRRGSLVLLAIAATGGFVSGVALQSDPVAHAEIRKATPQATFKSGSERSLPLLAEIGTTLKRIDARLARIESTLREAVGPSRDSGRMAP